MYKYACICIYMYSVIVPFAILRENLMRHVNPNSTHKKIRIRYVSLYFLVFFARSLKNLREKMSFRHACCLDAYSKIKREVFSNITVFSNLSENRISYFDNVYNLRILVTVCLLY